MRDKNDATPYVIICDAFACAYGTDGVVSTEYWGVGAAAAVTTLIEAGWLPPEADPPAHIDGSGDSKGKGDSIEG